jgi:glyoxylase I family protein
MAADASAPSVLSVHHLAVIVRDLDRAEGFYGGALGLAVSRRWSDAGGAPRSIWFALGGGAFLAVERFEGGGGSEEGEAGAARPGWHCVALGIAPGEREAFRGRLARAGHAIERETEFTLYARDPEGNLIGFSHHPEPRAAPSGGASATPGALALDGDGQRSAIVASGHGITEPKRSREMLERSEATLQAIVDNAPVPILVKDLEGRFTMTNPAWEAPLQSELRASAHHGSCADISEKKMHSSPLE